jgi:hypothetical protein
MHFLVLVIGDNVEKQLAPFKGEHWDYWQVGGRFPGMIQLKDGATGTLGDHRAPEVERLLKQMAEATGGVMRGPAEEKDLPPGRVDIARAGDVMGLTTSFAIVQNGEWRGSWDYQNYRIWNSMAATDDSLEDKAGHFFDESKVAAWHEEFSAMMNSLSGDTLLTVVDCHN